MANHGFAEPAANFTYTDGRGGEPGVFRLQAMRNISAGEEVGGESGARCASCRISFRFSISTQVCVCVSEGGKSPGGTLVKTEVEP